MERLTFWNTICIGLLSGLSSQQSVVTARWFSNKTPLYFKCPIYLSITPSEKTLASKFCHWHHLWNLHLYKSCIGQLPIWLVHEFSQVVTLVPIAGRLWHRPVLSSQPHCPQQRPLWPTPVFRSDPGQPPSTSLWKIFHILIYSNKIDDEISVSSQLRIKRPQDCRMLTGYTWGWVGMSGRWW